jgi:hypothetical protein
VRGSGRDIGGKADSFYFLYQPVTGDFQITVVAHDPIRTSEWAKAGLMMRESLTAGTCNTSLFTTPDHGLIGLGFGLLGGSLGRLPFLRYFDRGQRRHFQGV